MASDLETTLLRHDWFYNFSDDHRVWKRGQLAEDVLKQQMAASPFSWGEIYKAFTTAENPKRAEILEWARNNG